MIWYILKRLLLAIPVVVIVSIIAFLISINAPGDVVENRIAMQYERAFETLPADRRSDIYRSTAASLNRDLPPFYFEIVNGAAPDTLYNIIRKSERAAARSLLHETGNWKPVHEFRKAVIDLSDQLDTLDPDSVAWADDAMHQCEFLLLTPDVSRINYLLGELELLVDEGAGIHWPELQKVREAVRQMDTAGPDWRQWIPAFNWYGVPNQYHNWASNILRGDFGTSVIDGRPATERITEALRWTLRINIPVILLAFGISIPLGVAVARRAGSRFDKYTSWVLFVLFAIPSFWLATIAIVFFTTPEYGAWLDWFPTQGTGNFRYATNVLDKLGILISHLFLPVACLLAGNLAYLTRQMRNGMLGEIDKDYIRLARAKGLSERQVYWKHAFPNALFPILTLIGSALPASISGSVIIEVLFSVPGMGRLLYESILAQDWQVAFVIVILVAVLTVAGYILSDILYKVFNPVIRFERRMI